MDTQAYERVVMEQKDRLFSYASLILRNPAEAQDVAQEALIRLWRHRAVVCDQRAHFWLRRAAHNLCIDLLRRRKTRPEAASHEVLAASVDGAPDPRRRAESSELSGLLGRALSSLAARDRAVIVLREVEGRPYEEIAEILGIPLGTLKVRLHRAREQLRAKLVRAGVTP